MGGRLRARAWILGCVGLVLLGISVVLLVSLLRHARWGVTLSGPTGAAVRTPAANGGDPGCSGFHPLVCRSRGETVDATGTVLPDLEGEVRALRLYEQVARAHPEFTRAAVDRELALRIYTPQTRKKLDATFEWVLQTMIRWIDRQGPHVFSTREKRVLKKRLRAVRLEEPPPEMLTKNDIYYERLRDGSMRLRVGGAYVLSVTSWFNQVFTLAHELAHAIDPCEMRNIGLSLPAYDRLAGCFQRQGLVEAGRLRKECWKNDHLSETFADWMAVEVVGEGLRKFATEFDRPQLLAAASNSVRDLCAPEDGHDQEVDVTFHPSPAIRIERIFGENPTVREVLGCGEQVVGYCGVE